ncbi:hypothetical protein [Flavobacterium sp. N1994]|uniref:hypothetical protein n=1 Tax=Flavobacterium sp. N1994 TaxID=2986827 RepID=UPI002222E940|nr:hypothetical protein [Flavobacterium sp. N1994]
MKKICFLLFFVFLLNACSSSSSQQSQLVIGTISNNSEYKGGANPPQEILDALAIYNPSANQTFYIRNALNYTPFTPIISTITTDNNGSYSTSLPVGSYAIISQEKYDFEQNPLADANCSYLQVPDFTLTIVANQVNYNSQYTDKVNYCLALPQ